MKQFYRLTTVVALLLFFVGSSWGQTTASYDFSAVGAVTGLNEDSPGIALDANIGFGSFKNSSGTNPAIYSGQLRLYQNATKGGSIKIYASNGVTITQVIVHASDRTGPAAYTVDGGTATDLSAGTTYTMSSLSATSVVEFYQKDASSSNRIYVDDFEVTYTSSGNIPPSITNITQDPSSGITSSTTVSVSATVTDSDGTLSTVELHWGTTTGMLSNTISMTNGGSGDTYTTSTDIPAQLDGTTVYYEIAATDDEPETTTSDEQSYTVTDPSPTITLSETELTDFTYVVDNGPSEEQSFTVEGSNLTNNISIDLPTDPASNYEISTGTGGSFVATNPISLTQSGGSVATTTIYVRLKEGLSTGDYNDEDIAATSTGATSKNVICSGSVTDGSGGCASDLIISEVNENGNQKYIEIANFTGESVSLTNYDLAIYSNGNTTFSLVDLTDISSIANGDVWVLANTSSTAWSGTPDQTSGSFSPNGNDVIALRKNGTNIDVFGTIGSSSYFYNDKTAIRNSNITAPSTSYSTSDWAFTAYSGDSPATLGTHTMDCSSSAPDAPTGLSATANGTDQIDLSWTENAAGNDVLIAWSSDNTFGTPVNGTTYANGASIPDGGTSLGTVADGAYSHISLTSNTAYYYKIWSVDGSTNYSTTGAISNATTDALEPTNHPTAFAATANSSSEITVNWTDATAGVGEQLPDAYLIKAAIDPATPTTPTDGVSEEDATLVKNIAQGVGSVVFTGLDASTTYNFSIWPYTNSGDDINYKTDGTIPQDDATTDAAPALPNAWINEIHYDNDGGDVNEMIEIVIENPGNYTLSNFTVNLYNGNGGGSYDSETLDNFTVGNTEGGFIFYTWTSFSSGIQNGAPDGLALSFDGSLIQFLSYEGTFEATDGVAVGVVSTDIGVSETGTTPVGYSLQLNGLGTQYSDFTWQEPALATAGTLNNNQAFVSSTWTGGASTIDWVTAGNWSNGVPTATVDVIINNTDYDPAISSAASCNSITINSGAILTINAGKSLTVNGTLTNSAGNTGLVLESDAANGNAYLIHSTADVAATVKNYFTGAAESWHLLSSPVASQEITGDFIPAGSYDDGTGYDIYTWYEEQELWVNFKNGTTAPTWTTVNGSNNFLVGNGYMVAYEAANPTKSFAGNLNQGEVTYALTNSGSGTYESMNLVGNPYPSAIDWKASSGWDRSNLGESSGGHNMYIYNQTEGNYGAYNSGSGGNSGTNGNSRYITSCQGFLVYASSAGNLVMDNDIRVTDHQAFLKSDEEISDYLKLRVTGSSISYSDEAIIEFNHGSDEGGAPKLFSSISEAPSLYTLKNTEEYSINFLRELNEDIIVPLGFSAGVDGSYTINATQLESFKNGTKIYLEDKNLNTTIELSKTSSYTFTASTTDASDRFLLHFKSTTAVEDMETLEANIYAYDGKIYISGINQMNNVRAEVLSVDGRTLYTESYHGEAVVNVPGHFVPGCYLVRLSSEKAVLTKKLIIR